jgi:hypothetical protein
MTDGGGQAAGGQDSGLSATSHTSHTSYIDQVIAEQIGTLAASRISLTQDATTHRADGKVESAQFTSFLSRYQSLKDELATSGKSSELGTVRREHLFFADFAEMAITYLKACQAVPTALTPLLKRHFYRFISIFNDDNAAAHIFDYKKSLPRVGLCYFPNSGPRQFIVDALNSQVEIVDMEPGKMLETVWKMKGYDFDYALYQKSLRDRVASEVNQLPPDFVGRFPSRDWLIDELAASTQYQWAMVELLKAKYWDVIFIGAAEIPLGQALYDVPPELLPPVISLCHGMPSGDPLMNFFTRIDQVVVRCEAEKDFYESLGVPLERITFVGSTDIEAFPSKLAASRSRADARAALGLEDEDTVILYATTYDISIYNSKSPQEVMSLLLDAFRSAADAGLKNPILYVKYHPSPASDPNYSYSRAQYPFEEFGRLHESGYRVRLCQDLESVLPAADCFLAHESTTLVDAMEANLPTISVKMHDGEAVPVLGRRAYTETDCHKHLSVFDSGGDIGRVIYSLASLDREQVYNQNKVLWQNNFVTGRSAGLMKLGALVKRLLATKV